MHRTAADSSAADSGRQRARRRPSCRSSTASRSISGATTILRTFWPRGYVVAADDHIGHGGSVTDGLYGYFRGGWMSAVADEKTLHDKMAADYPGLPYYILGHSMGSFLLRTYLPRIRTRSTRRSSPVRAGSRWRRSRPGSSSASSRKARRRDEHEQARDEPHVRQLQ